ncbi:MAG: rRNA maturation RNase YbeY [Anaerolineae bacterium]|nr:rRNA maturation RNase YbeY [Anaerolineae bacterium]
MSEKYYIGIKVEDHVGPVDTQLIDDAVRLTLLHQSVEEASEVVIVISDDDALEELNRRFRGVAQPTDVLSFENQTRGPYSIGTAGFPRYLGDVVISLDRAREQADAAGGALTDELQLLAVHGVLHLLGYDHADEREKEQMWAIQSEILRLLDVDITLPK